MPILAGWITGEQVQSETIAQTLATMEQVLSRYGGQPARMIEPGMGLVAFSDTAYTMQRNDDPPALDWSPERRTLVYRRPLSGVHALYYVENWPAEGNLLFASEIKALFAVGVPRRLHPGALAALARYGFIPAPWTAFKDVQIVPAGSILRWQRAKTVLNHTTDYRTDEASAATPTLDQLQTLLDEASAGLLPPHEQLAALTSGGPASTLATLQAAQHTSASFPIVSLGYRKSLQAKQWDTAQSVATACAHPFLAITSVDQPEFWTATIAGLESPTLDTRPLALHQLLHTTSAETAARVAISGLGASVLCGTEIGRQAQSAGTQSGEMALVDRYCQAVGSGQRKSIWSRDVAKVLQETTPWEETLHARKLARRAAQFPDPQQGLHYLDLHLRLPDQMVFPAQQLAMQECMVIRSPYLHAQVMEALVNLPAMLDNGTAKEQCLTTLVERYMPGTQETLTGLPLTTPTQSLLRSADSELLSQVLSPAAVNVLGIFDAQAVEDLLKQPAKKDISPELLLVFTTQLLCQLFGVDGW